MRLLHLADVHLDTPFAGRTESLRSRLRDASRAALRRAVDDALREDVDVVLIAGDLFDGTRLSFETERFLVRELGRLGEAGAAVVYATGNHDPGRGGLRAHGLEWPTHVEVVGSREPRRIPVRRGDRIVGAVTAAGHETERETVDLSRRFPHPPGDLPEVALLHTQVGSARSAEEHDAYAPSELETLRRGGYDYWALGHVHTRQVLSHDPPIHYPGNLQGRTPRETGPRGGLMVDLSDRDDPRVEFRSYAPVRWEDVEVEGLEAAHTLERLVDRVHTTWERARAADGAAATEWEWIIRVILRGPTPLWRELAEEEDRRVVGDELVGRLGALDVTVEAPSVHPVVPVAEHRRRQDVLGEALRLAEQVREGADLPLDVGDLAGVDGGGEEDVGAYVRSLLDGAEGEILVRLLRTEE